MMAFLKHCIFILILISSSPGQAQEACYDIFGRQPALLESNPYDYLEELFNESDYNLDSKIHKAVVFIAQHPELTTRIPEEIGRLKQIQADIDLRRSDAGNVVRKIDITVYLLRLIVDRDLALWKSILVNEAAMKGLERFGNYGTMGYLLKLLPKEKQDQLLDFMADVYRGEKNHAVLQPIHLLLDPKGMYDRMKSEGRSDREFYQAYLSRIHDRLFSQENIGGYSVDSVLRIVEDIQQRLIGGKITAINFFGSVPNGFGKPESDLDVFTSTREDVKVFEDPNASMDDLMGAWLERSTPVGDRNGFQAAVDGLLRGTPWRWQVNPADPLVQLSENFGSQSHVFVFHIDAGKIVLRFYFKTLDTDEAGNFSSHQYIDLEVFGG
jgi:hypothetical protein